MNPVQHKIVRVTSPAAIVDNASLSCLAVDRKGFDFARFVFYIGAIDIALTALKIQESDTLTDSTTLANAADVTGAIFGTSTADTGSASTLPSATADNTFVTVEIDLRGRKRYLNPVVTVGDGTAGGFVAVWCELYRGEQVPTTAAQKGVGQNLRVPVIS